MTNKNLSKLI